MSKKTPLTSISGLSKDFCISCIILKICEVQEWSGRKPDWQAEISSFQWNIQTLMHYLFKYLGKYWEQTYEQTHYRSSNHLERHFHLKLPGTSFLRLISMILLTNIISSMRFIWMIDLFIRGVSPYLIFNFLFGI